MESVGWGGAEAGVGGGGGGRGAVGLAGLGAGMVTTRGGLGGPVWSTSPSGSPLSDSRRSRSGTGSPRDLSPPILAELAEMNLGELAKRPDAGGTVGRRLPVRANFFPIRLRRGDLLVSQYHVDIEHGGSARKLEREEKRMIFWSVVAAHPGLLGNPYALAYDGSHLLFSTAKLELNGTRLEAAVSLVRDAREASLCSVSFHSVGPVPMQLDRLGSAALGHKVLTPIQIMDLVFRQASSCPLIEGSAKFYPWKSSVFRIPSGPGEALDLGGGVEMWTGFYSSVHLSVSRPILNLDVSHSAFYKARCWMVAFMVDVLNEKLAGSHLYQLRNIKADTVLSRAEWRALSEAVKGLRVRVEHQGGAARVYRINCLEGPADELSFNLDSEGGKAMTVASYFGERYGPLAFPRLPCLHVGHPQRHIYFPIEVCTLDFPKKLNKKLSEKQTSAVIRAAAVDAVKRADKICGLAREAGLARDPFLDSFGLAVGPQMMEMEARVLPTPLIQLGSGATVAPSQGVWGTDGQTLLRPALCQSYALLALVPQREQAVLQKFCDALWRKSQQLGMGLPHWPDLVKFGRSREELGQLFQEILAEYGRSGRRCQLVLIVMPAKSQETYMVAKEASDLNFGIMSQCLLMKTVAKPSPATCANILLKLNAKLGGINWRAVMPGPPGEGLGMGLGSGEPWLVCGVDVTHPSLLEERDGMPSVAAIVSNLDLLPTAFGANVKVQSRSRESVVYLLDAVRERLVHFYKATQQKPSRILVFRDGVSEGQFSEVLREEMQGIRTACLMLSPDYRPPITYVVVQKRHHARLFPLAAGDECGRGKNVPPGTVLDSAVTSPEGFDFYLCSHAGIQGTSRPSRYQVLWDESGLSSDQLQRMAYALCHNYARCPRAVSIPAPVYYAHLVAARARAHIKRRLGLRDSSVSLRPRPAPSPDHSRSHSHSHTDDALNDAVNVLHPFKTSMYFI